MDNSMPARFCKKCQCETERYTDGCCKVCKALSAAAYRAANPEKIKTVTAAYRAANPDKIKATEAARYAANPSHQKASAAARYAANIDEMKVRHAAWARANPEAKRIHRQNRRARKLGNGGTLSKGLAVILFELQKGKCACCDKPLGNNYHLDHIMPLALGGANTDENIQLLRQRCNMQKGSKHPDYFMQTNRFFVVATLPEEKTWKTNTPRHSNPMTYQD